jgi:hypothetical protein
VRLNSQVVERAAAIADCKSAIQQTTSLRYSSEATAANIEFASGGTCAAIADYKSAIQQTASLRYSAEGKQIEIASAQ